MSSDEHRPLYRPLGRCFEAACSCDAEESLGVAATALGAVELWGHHMHEVGYIAGANTAVQRMRQFLDAEVSP